MSRLPKWVDNYVAFVLAHRSLPFEFGRHDCCITSCDMIYTITGIDPASDFRYVYDSPLSALRKIKEYGDVDNIAEEVCAKHGWKEIAPNYGTRCDLVCLDTGGGRKALGWFDLDASKIMTAGMIGLQERPRKETLRAWRIE
mgnify:CR=1 FL=1